MLSVVSPAEDGGKAAALTPRRQQPQQQQQQQRPQVCLAERGSVDVVSLRSLCAL